MPLVHIHISEGKSDEKKQELMVALTDAIEKSLGAKRSSIRIFLHEFPLKHFMAGGVSPAKPESHGGSV